jgi:hypothetical protein
MAPPSALSESVYSYGTLVLRLQKEIDSYHSGGSRVRASCVWLRGRDFLSELTHSSMEYFSVGSLSHFRILLLPIGSISRTTFEQWAAEIRTLETLRLSDIPPGTKDEKGEHTPRRVRNPPPLF